MKIFLVLLFLALTARVSAQSETVVCSSIDYKVKVCNVPHNIRALSVDTKYSSSACVEGKSYFRGDKKVIVTEGCRAKFAYMSDGWEGGIWYDVKKCESKNYKTKYCAVGKSIVDLVVGKRLSKSACKFKSSYFISGSAIKVKKGCRADFVYGVTAASPM